MGMKLYQPLLFVGLGGTGCDVGAELERLLREELCGPDGSAFKHEHHRESMQPYQLPSCVQFVYADVNQTELDRLPRRVVPGPEHEQTARATASYVTGLVPTVASYPDLAVRLRLEAAPFVTGWLPPAGADEPRVGPLSKGAGQFPTVGRAALFGTFQDEGILPAVRNIRNAVGKLAGSAADLSALNGKAMQIRGVDVFIAFSVAGGTGTGIFYDYLHLIADEMRRSQIGGVKIYPLVLMPSAFPEGNGGGKAAELNAGRAMLDLFRLVDQQNGGAARTTLRGSLDQDMDDKEEVAVNYPGHNRIVIKTGTVQTGFLFSRPEGATRPDMHRSIASLVMSLAGTEMLDGDAGSTGQVYQSFADRFINKAGDRQQVADNMIGNRGVSTALVATLSVPIDDIAEILGARLLSEAISQISAPDAKLEQTKPDMEDFLTQAGVHKVLRRPGVPITEPPAVRGARDVSAALRDRNEAMVVGIGVLKGQLDREVPEIVKGFTPSAAARQLLGRMNVFQLERVVFGHHGFGDMVQQGGAAQLLSRRRAAPAAPQGYGPVPPEPPKLKDRVFLFFFRKKVEFNDEAVVVARNQQNTWYQWQTEVTWAHAWSPFTVRWQNPLDELQRHLSGLTRSLADFARSNEADFGRRSAELYRERVGVSSLLPPGSGGLDHFYHQVVRRMKDQLARDGVLSPNPPDAELLKALIGPNTWQEAFRFSVEQSPERAVSYLRETVKTAVKTFLRATYPGQQPILPRLHDLLAEAAGQRSHGAQDIPRDYLDEIGGKLAGLLSATFRPQGTRELSVLISYPADAVQNTTVEEYLKSTINLPADPGTTVEYRRTDSESVSVVLFRSSMGITEVDEVKHVLRRWAQTVSRPHDGELLRWRQRTGYDFGYLATREAHREEILHRLLCVLWNGHATIEGTETSPGRVNFELNGVTMTLPLTPLLRASSWASLLTAYEVWALEDDDLHRRFCAVLRSALPDGLDASPVSPSALYLEVIGLANDQVKILDEMISKQGADAQPRVLQMRDFWKVTLRAALDRKFIGRQTMAAPTLRALQAEITGETVTGTGE